MLSVARVQRCTTFPVRTSKHAVNTLDASDYIFFSHLFFIEITVRSSSMTCHLGGIWCSVAFFIPFSEKRNVDVFTPSGVVSPVGSSDQNDGTRTDYRINFAERFCARLAGYVLMTASVVRVTCTLLVSSIIEKNYFVTRRKLGLKNVAFSRASNGTATTYEAVWCTIGNTVTKWSTPTRLDRMTSSLWCMWADTQNTNFIIVRLMRIIAYFHGRVHGTGADWIRYISIIK